MNDRAFWKEVTSLAGSILSLLATLLLTTTFHVTVINEAGDIAVQLCLLFWLTLTFSHLSAHLGLVHCETHRNGVKGCGGDAPDERC